MEPSLKIFKILWFFLKVLTGFGQELGNNQQKHNFHVICSLPFQTVISMISVRFLQSQKIIGPTEGIEVRPLLLFQVSYIRIHQRLLNLPWLHYIMTMPHTVYSEAYKRSDMSPRQNVMARHHENGHPMSRSCLLLDPEQGNPIVASCSTEKSSKTLQSRVQPCSAIPTALLPLPHAKGLIRRDGVATLMWGSIRIPVPGSIKSPNSWRDNTVTMCKLGIIWLRQRSVVAHIDFSANIYLHSDIKVICTDHCEQHNVLSYQNNTSAACLEYCARDIHNIMRNS